MAYAHALVTGNDMVMLMIDSPMVFEWHNGKGA